MKKYIAPTLLTLGLSFATTMSHAEKTTAQQDVEKCFMTKTTKADRIHLSQWIFSVMAVHPDVKNMTNISTAQQSQFDKNLANLFTRLITQDCVPEIAKLDSIDDIGSSFEIMGQIAMSELIDNPEVISRITHFTKYIDVDNFKKPFEQIMTK